MKHAAIGAILAAAEHLESPIRQAHNQGDRQNGAVKEDHRAKRYCTAIPIPGMKMYFWEPFRVESHNL